MDPDSGGAESFSMLRCSADGITATHVVCDTLLTGYFSAQCQAMLSDHALLSGACAQDYAARWPGMTPPTPEQCQQFLGTSLIAIEPRGRALSDVLADMGMSLVRTADDV